MLIEEYLEKHAQENPNKMALAVLDECVTYKELWEYVKCLATYMKSHFHIKKGDYVVIRSSQTMEHIIVYLAIHLSGAIAILLEKDVPRQTLEDIIKQTSSSLLFSWQAETVYDMIFVYCLSNLKKDLIEMCDTIHLEKWIDFPRATDMADVIFTTGTTGHSKGVMLSHGNLCATAENLIYGFEMKKSDCMVVVGPLNHANSIRKVYTAIIVGSSVVVLNGMSSIKNFFVALEKYPVNSLCLPPSAVQVLIQVSGYKLSEYNNQIEYVENSTAPMPENLRKKMIEMLPNSRLYNGYGSSEAGSIVIYDYNHIKKKAGCIGKPSYNAKLFFVDEKGNRINASRESPGLIACDGKVNMQGYLGDEKLTRQVLRDGCVYTNDIGYLDKDGFVYLVGRKDDVINLGGLKISPTEVEEIVEQYKNVRESLLIEVSDSLLGTYLKLLVVPIGSLETQELMKYLRENLEYYKVPRVIECVKEISHTYNGKKDRKLYTK